MPKWSEFGQYIKLSIPSQRRPMNIISSIAIAMALFSALGMSVPHSVFSTNEGQTGGPQQIPGQDLGCHYPNPAGKSTLNQKHVTMKD